MEAVGFALTVLAEARTILKSLHKRMSCFKEEDGLVTEADDTLSRVTALADKIISIVEAKPNAIPEVFLPRFKFTVETVKKCLATADRIFQKLHAQFFPRKASGSGAANVGLKIAEQFLKAKSVTKALREILGTASRAEGTLQLQLTQLCGAVKTDDLEDIIRTIVEQNCSPADSFRPAFNAPAVLRKVRLDFESKDRYGNFWTPEGKLRQCVFVSTNTKNVTVARGASSSVHGVSGMAGVGKTTALIGIGHDPKTQAHFVDGILYMSLGAAATEESVANERTVYGSRLRTQTV